MIESAHERDPLEQLADEFAARFRGGETPSIAEYVARHPQYAEEIEELFPTVAWMEQFRAQEEAIRRSAIREGGSAGAPPQPLGDFEIVREIGRGGMGIVYEAIQKSLGRPVAVKVLPRHGLLLEKDLRRFRSEAQTAARLRHTNIIPVFGIAEQDGLHYYVMPLVRGVGLDAVIAELRTGHAQRPGVPGAVSTADHWRFVVDVGVQAAEALAYAHQQHTLHRDIKPGNLLLDENGVLCVADFGLARAIHPSEDVCNEEPVGTWRYVAPEQIQGKPEARSDIYSLGVTLYELLTLRPAFEKARSSPSEKGNRAEPVRPRSIDPAIPRDLETIVLKCMAPEPGKRYAHATALAADLRRFLDGRPIRARYVSPLERCARWCRRNRLAAAASALAGLLLIAVVITALAGHWRTRQAYGQTREFLARAETTSELALHVLDDIYLQLSPDRFWMLSNLDGTGEVCVCLGLRSGAGLPTPGRRAMQVEASENTAALLEGLLIFYDRLAAQNGDDFQVGFQSAIARRRVGDIRQRLGQLDEAESEYAEAIAQLAALQSHEGTGNELPLELARIHNELGNVQTARLETGPAYHSHQRALAALEGMGSAGAMAAEFRYELARTLYLLANKHTTELGDRRGEALPGALAIRRYSSRQCRETAVRLLEQLVIENPVLPDYRFLLALCLRPPGVSVASAADAADRRRAIEILERLKDDHPEVDDYHYELTATYAWVQVGLFPWQRPVADPGAEESLRKALAEARWLTAHNPSIPVYACAEAIALAKLGELCRRDGRLAEAQELFEQAVAGQKAAVARFSGLPSHHQVLLEFMRLKLAESRLEAGLQGLDEARLNLARDLVTQCIENLVRLAANPELAEDRLTSATLPAAYELLRRVLAELAEDR